MLNSVPLSANTYSTGREECLMSIQMRTLVHALVFLLGLGLMVGGIIAGKPGASVIGLCVAAVTLQQFIRWKGTRPPDEKKPPSA